MIDFAAAAGIRLDGYAKAVERYRSLEDGIDVPALLLELGLEPGDADDDEWTMSCPLPAHGGIDSNPSFGLNHAKRVYGCYKCGGGNLLSLVHELAGLDWPAALALVTRFSDLADDADDGRFAEAIEAVLSKVARPEPPVPWYPARLVADLAWSDEVAARGITREVAARFRMGWRPLHAHKGFEGPAIVAPHWVEGDLAGWQARWTCDRPDWLAKSSNTDGLPRVRTLYGLDEALAEGLGEVAVVEAPLTALRIWSIGFPAVATFGAAVSDEQCRLLRRFARVLTAFDNDGPGDKASARVGEALDPFCDVWEVPCVDIGVEGADLGDVADDALAARYLRAAEPWQPQA